MIKPKKKEIIRPIFYLKKGNEIKEMWFEQKPTLLTLCYTDDTDYRVALPYLIIRVRLTKSLLSFGKYRILDLYLYFAKGPYRADSDPQLYFPSLHNVRKKDCCACVNKTSYKKINYPTNLQKLTQTLMGAIEFFWGYKWSKHSDPCIVKYYQQGDNYNLRSVENWESFTKERGDQALNDILLEQFEYSSELRFSAILGDAALANLTRVEL